MRPLKLISRTMVGGLYFGRPAWRVMEWPEPPDATATEEKNPEISRPENRPQLGDLLRRVCPGSTGSCTPALVRQIADLADRRARLLILNLLPAQPESLLPAALTQFQSQYLAAGAELIARCLDSPRVMVALDRHDRPTWRAWRRLADGRRFRIHTLVNRYPQAHPVILTRCLTGTVLSPASLPSGRDIVVLDPVTCWVLGRFLRWGRATTRPVQVFVSGREPRLAEARVGQRVADFLRTLGIAPDTQECILNGMLAGEWIDPERTAIRWDTELISLRPPAAHEPAVDCIRCGWCVVACPVGLNPVSLLAAARIHDGLPVGDRREAVACIDCGLCSYVCPSRLDLAATIRTLRAKQLGMAAAAAELAAAG